jgi:transposase
MTKKSQKKNPTNPLPAPFAPQPAAAPGPSARALQRKSSGGRGPKRRGPEPKADWQIKHPEAAGIDIGSREHWVAVRPDRATPSRRRFGTCTPDLDELVQWLQECQVRDVAMESTGMYWLPVYERLEEAGFRVILVDARQTKNTAGRKSDLVDCEWIWQLHTYGLLHAAFRPQDAVCRLRTIQRHRRTLVESASRSVQHMQKALDGMNLHVHHALSDLTGQSGLAMIEAIIGGERDPHKLAALAHRQVKKTPAQLAAALTGNYRDEELFVLEQAFASFRHYQAQIGQCERKSLEQLAVLEQVCRPAGTASRSEEQTAPEKTKATTPAAAQPAGDRPLTARARARNEAQMLTGILHRILGVDLTAIPGLAALTVLTLLSELGADMSRWRNAKAFASWLGLCPNHRISGGRVLSATSRKVINRAATALRMAALIAGKTETPLGCFYRRKAAQFGAPKAITATAHKLACLIYEMIRTGQPYRVIDTSTYQKRYDEQRLKAFRKRARDLGYELVELKTAA